MKYKILLLLLLITISSCLLALGEKNILVDLSKVEITGGKFENNLITFENEGKIKTNLNFLKNRHYSMKITSTGENVKSDLSIIAYYKYGIVDEYKKEFILNMGEFDITGKDYIKSLFRQDKTVLELNLIGNGPFSISKIEFTALDEPLIYGYFITPQYRNILTSQNSFLHYRYFSNHEEIGKENKQVSLRLCIMDGENVKYEEKVKEVYHDTISFKNPKLPQGNYTVKLELKEGDNVLGTWTNSLIVSDNKGDFYIDGNGRIVNNNNLFLLIGLMGNLEGIDLQEAKAIGFNSMLGNNEGFFSLDKFLFNEINDFSQIKAVDNQNKLVYSIVSDSTFGEKLIPYSDLLGFRLKSDINNKIKDFFNIYGFYYPLINIIDFDCENVERNIYETLTQTQTGIIFNVRNKEDYEKCKGIVSFLNKYKDVILSNEEPKVKVFGDDYFIQRKIDDKEYVFLFEIEGREHSMDIFAPKKHKVYDGENIMTCDKKDKTKYSFTLKPYEKKVILVEK